VTAAETFVVTRDGEPVAEPSPGPVRVIDQGL
jgi:hypothetical protein